MRQEDEINIKLDRQGVALSGLPKAMGEALIGAGRLVAGWGSGADVGIGALGNFFKAFGELKAEESDGRRAFVLVASSLAQAFEDVLRDFPKLKEPGKAQIKALADDLLKALEARKMTLDAAFFESPSQFSFIPDFSRLIHDRLVLRAKTPSRQEIETALKGHMPLALARTVMAKPDAFKGLQDRLFNPANEPARRELERRSYKAGLIRSFEDRPLLGQDGEPDPVTLGQVFVPLRAYHLVDAERYDKESVEERRTGHAKAKKRQLVDFESHVLDWIGKADAKHPLMVLSGGPGLGKSSSLRALAARLVRERKAFPVYIPLQFMEAQTTLEERIQHVLAKRSPDNPLSQDVLAHIDEAALEGPVVLMFDGLDELVLSDKRDDGALRDLCSKISMLLKTRGGATGKANLLAIVAGRIAAAERASDVLEVADMQLLHFVPFKVGKLERDDFVDSESSKLLEDQRPLWWAKWRARRRSHPETLPDAFVGNDLTPLSREPLLIYFLAFSEVWAGQDGAAELNRNAVYDRVLRKFHERECDKDHENLGRTFRDFDTRFEPVLQSLAIAAWYDGTTRKGRMDDAFDALKRIDPRLVGPFETHVGEDAAFGASLAFHLRPVDGKKTYEFLHKTFAEYLVARRFIAAIKELPVQLETRGNRPADPDVVLKDWLAEWGFQTIDTDLHRFIRDEATFRSGSGNDHFAHSRAALIALLRRAQIAGMPAHEHKGTQKADWKIESFAGMTDLARNGEEALFVALNASLVSMPWEAGSISLWASEGFWKEIGPGNMLARLQRQIDQGYVARHCLMRLCLAKAHLPRVEISDADLRGADLREANLARAGLRGTDFSSASLSGTLLRAAILSSATFVNSDLSDANLSEADLRWANFSEANVTGADFDEANLRWSDLRTPSIGKVVGLKNTKNLDEAQLPAGWSVAWNAETDTWDIITPEGPYIDPRARDPL